ncbi:MAG: glycoside hydrolase family 38 C-terminal domain-containing protein [Terracidiphilus sp.]|jgi:alpha-mannosidase
MNISFLRFCLRPVALCFGFLVVAAASSAQPPTDYKKATAMLPPDAQTVVNRLGSFRELPDGVWKMHAGDLPHAEDADLDDSGWQTVARNSKAPNEAVWFRQTYQIPETLNGYDLTGARVWFQFNADANGPMPEILYFNGRRVALGDDLEPIVLFDKVKPGDKVVVAVKLLHTVDQKSIHGASLRVDFPEGRPNPEDLREEFLAAAELIPSLDAATAATNQATLYGAIADVDIKALDAHNQKDFDASLTAAQSKLEALRPLEQQATFYEVGNSHIDAAWLWPWTETVDTVKRTFGTALQLMYEYPDYHYTQSAAVYNEWLAQKYPDMNDEIKRRIKEGRWEVVGGMWLEPDLNMPDGESLVRQLLVGKRWYKQNYGIDVKVGWNPDSFGYTWQLPQIYKKSGVDYFVTQKMTWNDTNQLPFKLFWWESPDGSKVLAYFPHDYVNDTLNPVRLSDDLALARQKSTGLTDLMDLYGIGDHGGGPTRAMLDEGMHWATPGHITPKYQFGTAINYFQTVDKEIAPESPTWNYQSIAKGYTAPPAVDGKVSIPTWDSELYLEYHRGVFTTQANHKHNMRTAEEEVLNAEKWSSLAWLDGLAYPGNELTEDWKKVLFNQFHDLAAGSGIGIIYKEAQKDYDVVRWSTNEISGGAQESLVARINTKGAVRGQDAQTDKIPSDVLKVAGQTNAKDIIRPQIATVVIFNPLGWERSGSVTVNVPVAGHPGDSAWVIPEKGESEQARIVSYNKATEQLELQVPVRNIPALGYETLHVAVSDKGDLRSPSTSAVAAGDITLHSDPLVVSVDGTTGCITSIRTVANLKSGVLDPKSGEEVLAPNSCGNQLQFFKDIPKDYDAWNIDPGTYDVPPSTIDKADSVESVTGSDGSKSVRVTYHTENSKLVQTISLKGDEVNIDNDFDWHESHILLKAAFPLAATSNFATYEIPYGEIERPTTRNNSWEQGQFEVPAMRWADLSGAGPDGKVHGLSLINKDKYGYDAVGSVLRLTLLRSPKWPDPDADMGEHHFSYALYPHAGTWKEALTVRHGWEYDYPLQAVVTTAHAGTLPPSHSFASVSPDNVVLTAVKKAEDANGLIFRVYEWAGKNATAEFHVPPGATSATVTNLMETPEGDPLPVTRDVVKVPIHPYEILTIRVDYAKSSGQ